MRSALILVLLPLLLLSTPARADAPEPSSVLTWVETVQARRAALRDELQVLNARWREATDPRVRLEIARAITLAKLDFEIEFLEIQRAERSPVLAKDQRTRLDDALAALRVQRAAIAGDEATPDVTEGAPQTEGSR